MVKCTLSGKQTTTQALGAKIAQWIIQAGCGVMVRYRGIEIALTRVHGVCAVLDGGWMVGLTECRIYRATVQQIKGLANVG